MRRLARWTSNALTALSSLLCVATAGLWLYGAISPICVALTLPRVDIGVGSRRSELSVVLGLRGVSAREVKWGCYPPIGSDNADFAPAWGKKWQALGFAVGRTADGMAVRTESWGLFAPRWAACLVLAAGPLLRWMRSRRSDSGKPALCAHRSYDLTGNVSGVCPECGRAVPVSQSGS